MKTDNSAKRLAAQYGVSVRTIIRDSHFAKAVDLLAETIGPEFKAKILASKSGFSRKQIIAIAKLPHDQHAQAIATNAKPHKAPPASDTVSPDKPVYHLTLEAVPGRCRQADVRSLRWLLKSLLRIGGWRCVAVTEQQTNCVDDGRDARGDRDQNDGQKDPE